MDPSSTRASLMHAWIHFAIALISGGAVVAFMHGWWGTNFGFYASSNAYQAWSITALIPVAVICLGEFITLYIRAKVPSPDRTNEASFFRAACFLTLTLIALNAAVAYYSAYARWIGWDWHNYPMRVVLFALLLPAALFLFARFLKELELSEHKRMNTPSDDEHAAFRPTEAALS